MKYRHDLRLVRMNRADNTFHCDVHGLLPDAEAADVLRRSGFTQEFISGANPPRWKVALIDRLTRLRKPKCVALS